MYMLKLMLAYFAHHLRFPCAYTRKVHAVRFELGNRGAIWQAFAYNSNSFMVNGLFLVQ